MRTRLLLFLAFLLALVGCRFACGGPGEATFGAGIAPLVPVSALVSDGGPGAVPVKNDAGVYVGMPATVLTSLPVSSITADAATGFVPALNGGSFTPVDVGEMAYGAGEFGVATFDGTTVNSHYTLTGSGSGSWTYTQNVDVFFSSMHVLPGVTILVNGYRIFVDGIATIDNGGIVASDGNAATGGTGGLATPYGTLAIGVAGGNGHAGSGTGAAGTAQGNGLNDFNAVGGAGGATAAVGGTAGGAGGTYGNSTGGNGGSHWLIPQLSGYNFGLSLSSHQPQLYAIGGGAGGGGGGADHAGITGGGGGGGGGLLIFHARVLVNNGAIHANGGAGGNAFVSTDGGTGNAGGGGGGGAGNVFQLSRVRSGSGTIAANGGAGGSGLGTGLAGGSGSGGNVAQHLF